MSPTPYNISYIIPVKNGARFIESCLDHIEAEMHSGDEIIVVDNGSTDETVRLVRARTHVRLLEHPELNIGGLRNRGAQVSHGNILAFVDSDCLLQTGWRKGVVDTLEAPEVHATGSICDLPPAPTWVERAWSASTSDTPRSVEYIPSANLIIRRDVFEAVNGFDETLITDEDYDIGRKITQAGGKIIDSPEVRSIHLGNSKTIAQFVRRQKWHAVSILDTLAKDGWDKPMIMTVVFLLTGLLALASLAAAVWCGPWILTGIVVVLLAPLVTAGHRIARNGHVRYFPHLLVLYFLFYLVRSLALAQGMFRKTTGKKR